MNAHSLQRAYFASAVGAAALVLGCAASTRNPYGLGTVHSVEASSAQAATQRGDWQTAACSWFAVFEAGGQNCVHACVETARALCELGDAQSAKGVLDQGLARHPGDPELLEMHGNVLCQLGFRRAAESSYLLALETDPDRASALLALARVRVELGMENSALSPLNRRIELGHGDAATYELLARAHGALGHARESLDAFARAFELGAPDSERALAAARVYADDRALRRDPKAQEQVFGWLTQAVEIDPQNTDAHLHLAFVCEDRGDEPAAVEHYRRAIETDPLCVKALTQLAELHWRRSEYDQAAEMARRALALEKDASRRASLEHLLAPPVETASTR